MGYLVFVVGWRLGGAWPATQAVAGWAVGTSLVSLFAFRREPDAVVGRVLRARAYRDEMLQWLESGRGPESRPLRTVRSHVYELAAYLVAAVSTANLLSLVMGAVLLNTMNAWVATLLGAARNRWKVALLAWNSWSVIRVAAYVMLGSACAAPLAGAAGYPVAPGEVRSLLWLGAIGVVLDLLLKLTLSRPCASVIAGAVDLDRARAGSPD